MPDGKKGLFSCGCCFSNLLDYFFFYVGWLVGFGFHFFQLKKKKLPSDFRSKAATKHVQPFLELGVSSLNSKKLFRTIVKAGLIFQSLL